jgi:heat shock protein HslJ
MRSRLLPLLLTAALLATACGEDPLTGPSALTGQVWKLQSLQRADFSVLTVDPALYTVEFNDGGRLSARADCNRCAGTYQTSGASLTVGLLACTRAFCGADSLDNQYTAILAAAQSHGVSDGILTIASSNGTLRYQP